MTVKMYKKVDSKQKTLFQAWHGHGKVTVKSSSDFARKHDSKSSRKIQQPTKIFNAQQASSMVSETVDLTDDLDDDLVEAAELLESSLFGGSSKHSGNEVEVIPGFDNDLGHIWIYPTNYPVRDYQYSIVRSALFKNTLVSLPTGLGKTFIAAVVMYNYYRWYPQGKIVFMAPTKPLVSQQIEACYDIMGIPYEDQAEITGMTTAVHKREALWNSKRVFFLTPQVINNDLARGVCPAGDIKCVVIDEAHKAQGKHAYCQVINQLVACSRMFRVLALSATPGTDVNSVQQVINNLLISHIEIRSEDSLDLRGYSHHRKVEKVVCKLDETMVTMRDNYLQVIEVFTKSLVNRNVLYHRDTASYSKYGILLSRDQFRKNPPNGLNKYEMGAIEGDFATSISLFHGFELLQQHGMRSFFIFLKSMMEGDKGNMRARTVLGSNKTFREMYGNLTNMFGDSPQSDVAFTQSGQNQKNSRPSVSLQSYIYSHPKIAKLEEVVLNHFESFSEGNDSGETRVMVFCQYRDTVQEITVLLQKHRPLVRPMQFVGHSTTTGKIAKFTQKDQLAVVSKFRAGGYNTLISTCVGEEGLDIGDVDLIVCFDAHKSPIRLVQRMGRTGRKRAGRIVMLVTEGKEERDYNSSVSNRKSIQKAITGNSSRSMQFYQHNPRMVPKGLNPQPLKMMMTVKERPDILPKGNKKTKKKMENADISFMVKNENKNSSFLNVEQVREWDERFKLSAEEKEQIKAIPPPGMMICLGDSEKPCDTKKSLMSLSEWTLWQVRLQDTAAIGHSTATKNFVEIMGLCDHMKQSESMDLSLPERKADSNSGCKVNMQDHHVSGSSAMEPEKAGIGTSNNSPTEAIIERDFECQENKGQKAAKFASNLSQFVVESASYDKDDTLMGIDSILSSHEADGSYQRHVSPVNDFGLSPRKQKIGSTIDAHVIKLGAGKDAEAKRWEFVNAKLQPPKNYKLVSNENNSLKVPKLTPKADPLLDFINDSSNGSDDSAPFERKEEVQDEEADRYEPTDNTEIFISCKKKLKEIKPLTPPWPDFLDDSDAPNTPSTTISQGKKDFDETEGFSVDDIIEEDENNDFSDFDLDPSPKLEPGKESSIPLAKEDGPVKPMPDGRSTNEAELHCIGTDTVNNVENLLNNEKVNNVVEGKTSTENTIAELSANFSRADRNNAVTEKLQNSAKVTAFSTEHDLNASIDMFSPNFDFGFDFDDPSPKTVNVEEKPVVASSSPVLVGISHADGRNASKKVCPSIKKSCDDEENSPGLITLTQKVENQALFADLTKMQNTTNTLIAQVKPQIQLEEMATFNDSEDIFDQCPEYAEELSPLTVVRHKRLLDSTDKAASKRKKVECVKIRPDLKKANVTPSDRDNEESMDDSPLFVNKKRKQWNKKVLFSPESEQSRCESASDDDQLLKSRKAGQALLHNSRQQRISRTQKICDSPDTSRSILTGIKKRKHSTPKPNLIMSDLTDDDDFADDEKQKIPKIKRKAKTHHLKKSSIGKVSNAFIDHEAEVSNDGVSLSSDEDTCNLDSAASEEVKNFVNDASVLTQHVGNGPAVDEQAMYLQRKPDFYDEEGQFQAGNGKFKLAYHVGEHLDVYSQEKDTDVSGYEQDSFICDDSVQETDSSTFGEPTIMDIPNAIGENKKFTRRQAELHRLQKFNRESSSIPPVPKERKKQKVNEKNPSRKRVVCFDESTDSIESNSSSYLTTNISKPSTAKQENSWTCPACTLLNKASSPMCELCDYEKDTAKNISSQTWACALCTYINRDASDKCEMCGEVVNAKSKIQKKKDFGHKKINESNSTTNKDMRLSSKGLLPDTKGVARKKLDMTEKILPKVKQEASVSKHVGSQLISDSSNTLTSSEREERLKKCRQKQMEFRARMEKRRSGQSISIREEQKTKDPSLSRDQSLHPTSKLSLQFDTPAKDVINSSLIGSAKKEESVTDHAVILVDSKELSSSQVIITSLKSKFSASVTVASLPHCDYIVGKGTAVGRLMASDILQVSNKQKLVAKFQKLNIHYDRVYAVIEQDHVKKGDLSKRQLRTSHFVSTVCALTQCSIRLLYSETQEETANILQMLAGRERGLKRAINPEAAAKANDPKSRLLLKIYLSIPKVSYVSALYMCLNFKNFREAASSSVEKLIQKAHLSTYCAAEVYTFFRRNFDIQMIPA